MRVRTRIDNTERTGGTGKRLPVKGRKRLLEEIYELYHHARFISPDPLEFLYFYPDKYDREVVGLIASSLAYGRVAQILKSVESVLARMGPSPRAFLENTNEAAIREIFAGFKHRFTTDTELSGLLLGIRGAVHRHGSLGECFLSGLSSRDETTVPALSAFVRELRGHDEGYFSLLPDPQKKSACKRLHLFLRWMVRSDEIDPGGWAGVSPSQLMVPLDTHMYRICSSLGMTARKAADETAACEITSSFKEIVPEDPVRYDFSLTRMGMRGEFGALQCLCGDAGLS